MFLEVVQAKHIRQYTFELTFNNGERKRVDVEACLKGEVFKPLQDIAYLKTFAIPYNTIAWPNGADFAPEFLYDLANKQVEKKTHETSKSYAGD